MSSPLKIEKLEDLIKGKIIGELVEQTVEPLVEPGENYGSVIYKVDFKVDNGGKIDSYHGVAKCTTPNEMMQKMLNIQVTMKAEINWYTTVIPTIQNFQREHGVEQVADFFQNFYGSRISLDPTSDIVDINAVIFTENLKPLGFKNINRHIGFDLKTSKAILRDLATFHGVPIAIKIENKELFDKNIKPHLQTPEPQANSSEQETNNMFDDYKEAFDEIPEITPYIDRIATHLKNHKPYGNELINREPWGSICHNDFWINNIMIKDGNNMKTVLLDFQLATYASIALDVLFFLIVSVSQEVIMENMDQLIEYYWNEFLKNLKQLHMDTSIFTYKEFLMEINRVASSGLFARALVHTFLIQQDKGKSLFDSTDKNVKPEKKYNDRHIKKYKWLVLEFVKRDWI